MDALKLIITILQLLCGIAIILAVLVQSGKSAGLSGAIGGVADSFLAKNNGRQAGPCYQVDRRCIPDPDFGAADSGIS